MCSVLPQSKALPLGIDSLSVEGPAHTPWRSRFTLLSRFAPVRGLVILCQTFVRCCQSSHHTLSATALGSVGSQSFENARLRAISNRGVDGVFEIVRIVGRGLVSIAEVHAIVAGAQLAQNEPGMARDRFGFLERHEYSKEIPQGYSVSSADCCEV